MAAMHQRAQGFTLIEMLMVIVIIGFSISMVALSIGRTKDENASTKEAQTLLQDIDFISEQAVLNGDVIAMFIKPKDAENGLAKSWCYRWQRYRENHWGPLPDETIGSHCMPEGMQWELVIEGHPYVYDPDLETQPPVLFFAPSGETSAVEMAIFESGSNAEAQRIDIDMMGDVCWRNQQKAEGRNDCNIQK